MKEKMVVIEIDEQGNSSIDLNSFQGKGCADVAKDFQGGDLVKIVRNKVEFSIEVAGRTRQQEAKRA